MPQIPQQESELESHHEHTIEMAFAKLKAHLRKAAARTFDALIDAIGDICALYQPDECSNYFNKAGYGSY